MPRKILQLAKINKILIILIVLIVIAISTAYYMNYKPITKFLDIIIISIAICFIISLGIVNIYKQILSSKVRKAVNL
jgi:Mn2+/Fe2+ NRAMP family transporter